jgi:hypothetical protein
VCESLIGEPSPVSPGLAHSKTVPRWWRFQLGLTSRRASGPPLRWCRVKKGQHRFDLLAIIHLTLSSRRSHNGRNTPAVHVHLLPIRHIGRSHHDEGCTRPFRRYRYGPVQDMNRNSSGNHQANEGCEGSPNPEIELPFIVPPLIELLPRTVPHGGKGVKTILSSFVIKLAHNLCFSKTQYLLLSQTNAPIARGVQSTAFSASSRVKAKLEDLP